MKSDDGLNGHCEENILKLEMTAASFEGAIIYLTSIRCEPVTIKQNYGYTHNELFLVLKKCET